MQHTCMQAAQRRLGSTRLAMARSFSRDFPTEFEQELMNERFAAVEFESSATVGTLHANANREPVQLDDSQKKHDKTNA